MLDKIKEHKKASVLAVLLLVLILGFGLYQYRNHKAAEEAARQLVLYGNVDLREVSLAFKNSDRISDILVEEGDAVTKGQVLAKLDTADLEHRMDITLSLIHI